MHFVTSFMCCSRACSALAATAESDGANDGELHGAATSLGGASPCGASVDDAEESAHGGRQHVAATSSCDASVDDAEESAHDGKQHVAATSLCDAFVDDAEESGV